MPKNKLPLNINIIALGNRGCNVLERLDNIEKQGIGRSAISVNGKVFKSLKIKNKIELPFDSRLEKAVDKAQIAKEVLLQKGDKIIKQVEGNDAIFLLLNLSNPIACYQAEEIAKLAKQKGILTFCVSSIPFPFEGKIKQKISQRMKKNLSEVVDGLLVVDNDKIITQDISAQVAMTQVDKVVADLINSIIEIVTKYGIINVDFSDLKSTILDSGEVFFNSVSVDDKNIDNLVDNLLGETNLEFSSDKLEKALYVIYTGRDVLMEEISQVGDKIKEKLSDSARIIFGVVNDDKMKNKMRVVVIGG